MSARLVAVSVAALVHGCGGGSAKSTVDPAGRASTTGSECEPTEGDPQHAYDELEALDNGAPWPTRYAAAVKAAKAGHPDGQAQAGGLKFASLFEEEPDANNSEQRDQYTAALTWLFTGTLRGSEYGKSYAPGLERMAPPTRVLSAELEPPLGDVPRPWLEAAWSAARSWGACHD
jgi:hypothetical protein